MCIIASLGVHEERDNQPVQSQDFSENEDENHADEETWLLCCATDTGVTNDTNGESKTMSGNNVTNLTKGIEV